MIRYEWCALFGMGCITLGVWLVYPPAALIVAGLIITGVGLKGLYNAA